MGMAVLCDLPRVRRLRISQCAGAESAMVYRHRGFPELPRVP